MTKQDIVRELRQEAGGAAWISKSRIASYLGKSREYAAQLVGGLERFPAENGQAHLYHVKDVAERIMEKIK